MLEVWIRKWQRVEEFIKYIAIILVQSELLFLKEASIVILKKISSFKFDNLHL